MSELHPHHEDHPDMISRSANRGLFLFAIYFALFLTFLLLNILSPGTMAKSTFTMGDREVSLGGPNLAVIYGIGLIFAAFILALVYMRLTRKPRA